jgi:hypothetical protein
MPIAHVILHLALCGAIARANPEANVAMRVRLSDRADIVRLDKALPFERGDDNMKVIEFDVPAGSYRMDLATGSFRCSSSAFVFFIPNVTRTMDVTLSDGPVTPSVPILFQGLAPTSFLYAKPTFVLIDKSVACDKPVGDLLPSNVAVENDDDAYYATMQIDPNGAPATLALRLQTPTHQYHYIRIPSITYPPPLTRWPIDIGFDVTQDEIDDLATRTVGTLLCLKLWETKVASVGARPAAR